MRRRTFKRIRFISLVMLILVLIKVPFFANDNSDNAKNIEITVSYGDTLWSIADEYSENTDPRDFIVKVKKLNNMKTSEIFAGDKILVPLNG